jgi:cell division protein FtsL
VRGIMEKVYVSVKRNTQKRSLNHLVLIILSSVLFVIVTLYMRAEYNGLREELIESLRQEREVADVNNRLKMELSVITRARYIELKANERLGLKKPKEEEVLVLR